MNYLDIFFIVVLAIGGIKGYMKGLIVELFSFLAFFFGLFVAIELTIPVANRFFDTSDQYQLLSIGVFVALFLVAILIINLLAKMVKKVVDLTFLGFLDNILGSIAGAFKWAFIISVFFWVFDSLGARLPEEQSGQSFIFPYVESLGPKTFALLGEVLPFLQDMIDSLKGLGDQAKGSFV